MAREDLAVSVVFALPERQHIAKLKVPAGATVEQAVQLSGFEELAGKPVSCAIYGRPVALTQIVEEGDRIEILRPLRIDPKENRRQAAAKLAKKSR